MTATSTKGIGGSFLALWRWVAVLGLIPLLASIETFDAPHQTPEFASYSWAGSILLVALGLVVGALVGRFWLSGSQFSQRVAAMSLLWRVVTYAGRSCVWLLQTILAAIIGQMILLNPAVSGKVQEVVSAVTRILP